MLKFDIRTSQKTQKQTKKHKKEKKPTHIQTSGLQLSF